MFTLPEVCHFKFVAIWTFDEKFSFLGCPSALAWHRIDQCFASAFTSERRGAGMSLWPVSLRVRDGEDELEVSSEKVPQSKSKRPRTDGKDALGLLLEGQNSSSCP